MMMSRAGYDIGTFGMCLMYSRSILGYSVASQREQIDLFMCPFSCCFLTIIKKQFLDVFIPNGSTCLADIFFVFAIVRIRFILQREKVGLHNTVSYIGCFDGIKYCLFELENKICV